MARTIVAPCPAAPAVLANGYPGLISKTFPVEVITPLFGGGVEAGENDPVTLVRVPAIRGQLRTAWRLTRGLAFTTARELRQRESEVWGAASSGSRVVVEVNVRDAGREISASALSNVGYALFPFAENRREQKPARNGREGVRFDLTVRYPPELQPEVMPGLWAFFCFLGLGARTRRGAGAVACPAFAPTRVDGGGEWFRQLRGFFKVPDSADRPWPVLGEPPLVSAPLPDARQAWAKAVGLLREFRQGYGVGRREGPGRSYWPEADSLRMISGRGAGNHMESLTVDEPGFPRAEMGLPIVMHFKDREDGANNCTIEPAEPGLEPKRMSSPLILRPLAVSGGKYVAMVVRLRAPRPRGVRLREKSLDFEGGPEVIERTDFANYQGSPMKGTGGSAVDAFMAFAKGRLA